MLPIGDGMEYIMKISDVKIRRIFENEVLKAVASVTFDECFAVHDIKVIFANDRYFIVMPSKKTKYDTNTDIAHPINSDFRNELEGAVLEKYFAATDKTSS